MRHYSTKSSNARYSCPECLTAGGLARRQESERFPSGHAQPRPLLRHEHSVGFSASPKVLHRRTLVFSLFFPTPPHHLFVAG
jgi:hypothetical protein